MLTFGRQARRGSQRHGILAFATHSREPFFEIARKYCTPGARVLDVGCGGGEFVAGLDSAEVYLLDGNPDTVELLRKDFANVFLHRVPERFPFEDALLDVVHCSHLVEHLSPEDLYSLMVEVDRCVKPGGHFVVSAPLLWSGFYDDLSHVRPYTPAVFEHYLCGEGADVRTRSRVSSQFVKKELQYRYRRAALPFLDISSRSLSSRVLGRCLNWLRSKGVSYYERSGYTLVLQKTLET